MFSHPTVPTGRRVDDPCPEPLVRSRVQRSDRPSEGLVVTPTPVVLVHGAWLHASSWTDWAKRFAGRGYAVTVPAWPDEAGTVAEARVDLSRLSGLGLDALTARVEEVVRSCAVPPVLVGHSVGGLVAQHLLGRGLVRAAVAIAPMPARGVPLPASQTRLWPMMSGDPANRYGVVPLLPPHFQHVYANTVGRDEAASLYERHVVQAPARLLAELGFDFPGANEARVDAPASASVDTGNSARGPLLLISGQEDRMVADEVTRSVYKLYGDSTAVTDLKQFADRGHSLVIDSGRREVADHVLGWLADQGVHPRTRETG